MGDNDTPAKRLRHLFVLMTGLGMRESSGRYCEGRDRSADNTAADTAGAGLFQVSCNLLRSNRDLNAIFDRYEHNPAGHLDIFKEGVTCKASDWKNFGSPNGRGYCFQDLTKKCPAFAVEIAALGLRLRKSHWGPILRREAEVLRSCEDLFIEIEEAIPQPVTWLNAPSSDGAEPTGIESRSAAPYYRAMADEPINLVLEHLRAIRADLAEVKEGVRNLQVRMTSVEENMAAMNRRLDSIDRRIDRIERRLELVDAT